MTYTVYISDDPNDPFGGPSYRGFADREEACQAAARYYNRGYEVVTVGDEESLGEYVTFMIRDQPRPVVYTEYVTGGFGSMCAEPTVHYIDEPGDDGRNWGDIWAYSVPFASEECDLTSEALEYDPDLPSGSVGFKEDAVNVYNGRQVTIYYWRDSTDAFCRPGNPDDVAFIVEWV